MKVLKFFFIVATLGFVAYVVLPSASAVGSLQVSITITEADGPCINNQIILSGSAVASGGVAPYTFTWLDGAIGGGTSNPNIGVKIVPGGSSESMCVRVTDSAGTSKIVCQFIQTSPCTP